MRWFVLGSLMFLLLASKVGASQVSLIEEDANNDEVLNSQINESDNDFVEEDADEQDDQDDAYEQMNDFLQEEDQKLRVIKLLNLDLEKTTLEFKKREVEQKLSQLNKAEGTVFSENTKPNVKLLGLYENAHKKGAILDINGSNTSVTEGQVLNGMVIKNISNQTVLVEYEDGDRQELNL